ncbi:MAG TPA: rod-binding protein [Planctomycetaceae bacterium]|nr:rod-binding protein [Planctomycetaceae bacterium]
MSISTNPNVASATAARESSIITQKGATTSDPVKSARVDKAIKDFEGLFMSMMIKELRQTSSGDGLFPGDASDTYGGMFDMMLGNQLAAGKGLGLESLFRSSAAISQVEDQLKSGKSLINREQALQGYQNAQLQLDATSIP